MCNICNDVYCDICFNDVHKKGKLSYHTSSDIVDHCDICHNHPARWNCVDCKQNTCYTCYLTTHTSRILKKHVINPIQFKNIEYKNKEEENIKKKQVEHVVYYYFI